jgi:hypothetical protein
MLSEVKIVDGHNAVHNICSFCEFPAFQAKNKQEHSRCRNLTYAAKHKFDECSECSDDGNVEY